MGVVYYESSMLTFSPRLLPPVVEKDIAVCDRGMHRFGVVSEHCLLARIGILRCKQELQHVLSATDREHITTKFLYIIMVILKISNQKCEIYVVGPLNLF